MSVVKIFNNDGEFSVWLDTEVADYDGLCIAIGNTREEAVTNAVADLEARLAELQQPVFQTRAQDDGMGTVEVMDANA